MSSADVVGKVNNQGGIICQGRKQEKNRCNVKLFPPSRECLSWSVVCMCEYHRNTLRSVIRLI